MRAQRRATPHAPLVLIGLALAVSCSPQATLPVFQLAPPGVDAAAAGRIGELFSLAGGSLVETPDRFIYRSGATRTEVYKASGGFWSEDTVALWNPDLTPTLPDTSDLANLRAHVLHLGSVTETGTRPDSEFAQLTFDGFGATYVATLEQPGAVRHQVTLDRQLDFRGEVRDHNGVRWFPLAGGGARVKVVIGDAWRPIGRHGVTRRIARIARRLRIISRADADKELRSSLGSDSLLSFDAELAYYSAPAAVPQALMYPVYDYTAKVLVDGVVAKIHVIRPALQDTTGLGPATTVNPLGVPGSGGRTAADAPLPGSTDPEGPEEGGTGAANTTQSWMEVGGYAPSSDLHESADEVSGVIDLLTANGWTKNFLWGGDDAWLGDWSNDRSRWVDATDLVYFAGHGASNGWMLRDHDMGVSKGMSSEIAKAATVGGPGMYGQNDTEWLVINACGPLQDERVSGAPEDGDALERWAPLFGGLHLLLGFATDAKDAKGQGTGFAQYALDGKTLVYSWLRAASDVQGPTKNHPVWVAAMWAYQTGRVSPWNDHLWGKGSVAEDSPAPDTYKIIWTEL